MPVFEYTSRIAAPADAVFAWHERPGAFHRLVPPWDHIQETRRVGTVRDGDHVTFHIGRWPFRIRWKAEHFDYEPGRRFCDRQVQGPFKEFVHRHEVLPDGPDQCVYRDRITYEIPLGRLGDWLVDDYVQRRLETLHRFRHRRVRQDVRRHRPYRDRGPQRVAITGSSGLIGSHLALFLSTGGHQVLRLVRRPPDPTSSRVGSEAHWHPADGAVDAAALEGVDAVVHLAGEPLLGPWTASKKRKVRTSRVQGTRVLSKALAGLDDPPRILLSASATGYYGRRRGETLTEDSPPGTGFRARVCRDWEAATQPAEQAGIRVVHLRIGTVLSGHGGALPWMVLPFRAGLGGQVGDGGHHLSWVALDDVLGAVLHLVFDEDVVGPVNVTAPQPVTHAELARALSWVLDRPAWWSVPPGLARRVAGGLLGEVAESVLLDDISAVPTRLKEQGFDFLYGDIEEALRVELGQTPPAEDPSRPDSSTT